MNATARITHFIADRVVATPLHIVRGLIRALGLLAMSLAALADAAMVRCATASNGPRRAHARAEWLGQPPRRGIGHLRYLPRRLMANGEALANLIQPNHRRDTRPRRRSDRGRRLPVSRTKGSSRATPALNATRH